MTKVNICAIGEVLWDVFPDGPRFGGAPSNFACSTAELAGATARVRLYSAVGKDDLGRSAIEELSSHGVDTELVQQNDFDTGQVLVDVDAAGVASYRFAENSAWDHLHYPSKLDSVAAECDAICFGTLGQRGEASRASIRRFIQSVPDATLKILDVNLRAPHYSDELIHESLELANVLKLNEDELPLIAERYGIAGSEAEQLQAIAEQMAFRVVALTRGSRGALIVRGAELADVPGADIEVVDTVGAGDAFTAAMSLGLLNGDTLDTLSQSAIATASYVCGQSGATGRFPEEITRRFR